MKQVKEENTLIAVVLIRSLISINPKIKYTLKMLNLQRKNSCVILKNNPSIKGMLTKVKDYVTWGEITAETHKILGGFSRLHPPRGGFERKGIKKSFSVGGALGYRGEKMNDLLRKMS